MDAKRTTRNIVYTLLFGLVLCFGIMCLGAEQAHADLAASQMEQANVADQAGGKTTMYVIASTTSKNTRIKSTAKVKYTYTKKGLLAKRAQGATTLETFKYNKKKLKSSWHNGGQGAPSNYQYTYKNGKLHKAYDKFNRNKHVLSLNKKGKIKKIITPYSSTYKVSTLIRYNSKNQPISAQYSTWSIPNHTFAYDAKGSLKKHTEYHNNSTSSYSTTNFKNTYKGGRLVKSVGKHQGFGSTYKTTVTLKYKKVRVPAAYKSLVKRQQDNIRLRYVGDIGIAMYGAPIGFF